MIRVLGLALYGSLAASTRYRLGQYVDGLAMQGIDLQIRSLLGNEYLQRRFANAAFPWSAMVRAGWHRMRDLVQGHYDLAVVYCELFPLAPAWLESALLARCPYIYDFDDAFYLKYRKGRLGVLRPLLGRKFDKVVKRAAAVSAGSGILHTYASGLNPSVTRLPTVVDTDRYLPISHARGKVFTVGWIGSPSTAPYLEQLATPLREIG